MTSPPKYIAETLSDTQGVSLLASWLSKTSRVIPDLKILDRFPSFDGNVQLVSPDGAQKDLINVQVRAISSVEPANPTYSFADNGRFLDACVQCVALIPSIFVAVDLLNEKAYWLHINEEFLQALGSNNTVHFRQDQIIDGKDESFVLAWERILNHHRNQRSAGTEKERLLQLFRNCASSELNISPRQLVNIQLFLDAYNKLLNGPFRIVKETFYGERSEVGFSYHHYDDNSVYFALYPKEANLAEPNITQIDTDTFRDLLSWGSDYAVLSNRENPIESDPGGYARRILGVRASGLFRHRRLRHTGSTFLAEEGIITILDKLHDRFGLIRSDSYKTDDIRSAFKNHLASVRLAYKGPVVKVETQGLATIPRPYAFLEEMLHYLEEKGVREVRRHHLPPDFNRRPGPGGVWSLYSADEVEHNMREYVEHIKEAYNAVAEASFPQLKRELSLFRKWNLVLFTLGLENLHEPYPKGPYCKIYCLVAPPLGSGNDVRLADKQEIKILKESDDKNLVLEYQSSKWQIVKARETSLDFLLSPTPVLDTVYNLIHEALAEHLGL